MKKKQLTILKKCRRCNFKKLIILIIFLIISIFLFFYIQKKNNESQLEPINMNDLIVSEKLVADAYAYVDVKTKPHLFAAYKTKEKKESNKFYLVMDENNYLYIVYMNDASYQKLNIDEISQKPIRIVGLTKKISGDIKNLAITSYNELMKDEYLTKENFSEYVGLVYLDTTLKEIRFDYILFSISLILTIIFLINYFFNFFKYKKNMSLIKDLDQLTVKENVYANMNLYLTKKYIIDISYNLIVLKYEDILWAYSFEHRSNGLLINKNIKLTTKDKKCYSIANTKLISKEKNEVLTKILNSLKRKNPNILIGYTKENRNLIKQKAKKNENERKI